MAEGRRARGLGPRRVIRALRKLGFEVDNIEGSHYTLRRADGKRVVIPHHDEVKVGLLLDSLKAAGISWDEFQGAL